MQPRETTLIINADDLGSHPSIDDGILELARAGIVTSASLLVTTPGWRDAADKARSVEGLGIGLHLDLTTGRACCKPSEIPDLVSSDGSFKLTVGELIKTLQFGDGKKRLLDQIGREFAAQFETAKQANVALTHFDGHQHVHMIPGAFEAAVGAARVYGVERCRLVNERLWPYLKPAHLGAFASNHGFLRWPIMALNRARLTGRTVSPTRYYGYLLAGRWNERLLVDCLRTLPRQSVSEFGVHPGYPAPAAELSYASEENNKWFSSSDRQIELDALASERFRSELEKRSIRLGSYATV